MALLGQGLIMDWVHNIDTDVNGTSNMSNFKFTIITYSASCTQTRPAQSQTEMKLFSFTVIRHDYNEYDTAVLTANDPCCILSLYFKVMAQI